MAKKKTNVDVSTVEDSRDSRTYKVVDGVSVNLGDLTADGEPELLFGGQTFAVDERHYQVVDRWERDGVVVPVE